MIWFGSTWIKLLYHPDWISSSRLCTMQRCHHGSCIFIVSSHRFMKYPFVILTEKGAFQTRLFKQTSRTFSSISKNPKHKTNNQSATLTSHIVRWNVALKTMFTKTTHTANMWISHTKHRLVWSIYHTYHQNAFGFMRPCYMFNYKQIVVFPHFFIVTLTLYTFLSRTVAFQRPVFFRFVWRFSQKHD